MTLEIQKYLAKKSLTQLQSYKQQISSETKMKYDLIFHFGYGKAESDWCKLYTDLHITEVDYLLTALKKYGEVPLDEIIKPGKVPNIILNQTFYIYLDKPRKAYLTVRVMESAGLAVHSILADLNTGLIEFIEEENKVEGFL